MVRIHRPRYFRTIEAFYQQEEEEHWQTLEEFYRWQGEREELGGASDYRISWNTKYSPKAIWDSVQGR